MRQPIRGTRARWVTLAITAAFTAQAVVAYTLLPLPRLPLTPFDQAMIASLGLVCLAWAATGLMFHVRRRVQFEDSLHRSETFARETVDALPSHIAILNQWGAIASTNHAWRAFAADNGADPASVGDGANYLAECDRAAARGCADAAAIGSAVRDVLRARIDSFSHEYTGRAPAGPERWFLCRISRFPGGGPPFAVVAHEDITPRKLAEERLEKARHAAEAANHAKSAFVANISHEIRTPMNAILGYADMLLDPGVTDDRRRDCVKVIRRNGEHLLAVINDVLDISKVEAHRMSAEKIPCDLPQLVADVVALTRPRADEKGLAFEVTFDPIIPRTIRTDPVRARQVLVNLVGNAVKFTPHGAVRIHVSRDITYFHQTVRFAVSDTGIGIRDDQLPHLFQPFTQADPSTTRTFGGTGLGLSISRRLAQLLGGDIAATSAPGAGSTFTFWLDGGPRDGVDLLRDFTQDQLAIPQPAPRDERRDRRLAGRILLAEDGEDNQLLLQTHLEHAGARVTLAVNGKDAVRAALAGDFDLVLMDMQMPVMDGYHAAAELRKAGYTKPVVALTAHAMAEDRARCLAAGCTDYLSKPIDRHTLLKTCAKYLPLPLSDAQAPNDSRATQREGEAPSEPRVTRGATREHQLSDAHAPNDSRATQREGEAPSEPRVTRGAARDHHLSDAHAPNDSRATQREGEAPSEPRVTRGAAREHQPETPSPAAPIPLAPDTQTTLKSTLATDPRVSRVLDRFIARLPERVQHLADCLQQHDLDSLRQALHNLKGAGAGYGFPSLTEHAARAEDAIRTEKDLSHIRHEVDTLIQTIHRVEGFPTEAPAHAS